MRYKDAPRKKNKSEDLTAANAVAVSIGCHSTRCVKLTHWVSGSVDDV